MCSVLFDVAPMLFDDNQKFWESNRAFSFVLGVAVHCSVKCWFISPLRQACSIRAYSVLQNSGNVHLEII